MDGTGWCVATSIDLAKGHPEKVLALAALVQRTRAEETHALTTALLEACRLCDAPRYRDDLCSMLARPEYLDAPEETVRNSLCNRFRTGHGEDRHLPDFHRFSGDATNEPTVDKAGWVISGLRQIGLLDGMRLGGLTALFRSDLYDTSRASLAPACASIGTATPLLAATTPISEPSLPSK
jgi:hypothetical protein